MSSHDIYPVELVESEKSLGFQIMDVENPIKIYPDQPKTVKAIVLLLDDYNRIIKIANPNENKPLYYYQKFGVYKSLYNVNKKTPPGWNHTGRKHIIADTLISEVKNELVNGEQYNILTPDDLNARK